MNVLLMVLFGVAFRGEVWTKRVALCSVIGVFVGPAWTKKARLILPALAAEVISRCSSARLYV